MFGSTAMAQTTTSTGAPAAGAPGPGGGGLLDAIGPFGMMLPIIVLFYFLMIRPQQKRAKEHQAMVAGVKRGDVVEMNNGMIGKVTGVADTEATVEIATGVQVKVVKSMLSNVRTRGEPAPANDIVTKK